MADEPIRIARGPGGEVEAEGPIDAFAASILHRAGFLSEPVLHGTWHRLPFDLGTAWENEHAAFAAQMLTAARYPVALGPTLRPDQPPRPSRTRRRAPLQYGNPAPPTAAHSHLQRPPLMSPEPHISEPIPSSADPVEQLGAWHRCYTAVHRRGAQALADLRDRYGNLPDNAAARQAVAERNRHAAMDFTNHLLPHADSLLARARTALATLPPARHHSAWKLLLDDLDRATVRSHRILSDQSAPAARNAALWPYITTWAEHAPVVRSLIGQHRRPAAPPSLPAQEQRHWTGLVQAARGRGTLDAFETWYDATGQQITLAHLNEEDATVLALAGDLNSPQLHVLGHYPDEDTAARSCPPPVPPGVLRPDVCRYDERVLSPEIPVQDLTQDVVEARQSGDVADLILSATNGTGPAQGALVRLGEFVSTCAEFSDALDTRDGQRFAARLHDLAAQVTQLTGELRTVGEDMAATVGVLPPYRTAHPRHLPPAPPPPALSAQRPAEQRPATAPTGITPRTTASPRR